MKYISEKTQFLRSKQKSEYNTIKVNKHTADIDYIAMMCDVELEIQDNDGDSVFDSEEA